MGDDRNKEHARLLRWHKEERKKDGKLRHPADGSQWRKIEREFPDFAGDARNLWFGLSTDGMNPFGEQSCSHSTWPVTLCIYNLPPWLCMKRKFIMMPVLIQVPKQPGQGISPIAMILWCHWRRCRQNLFLSAADNPAKIIADRYSYKTDFFST